jgi:hypothetical protein
MSTTVTERPYRYCLSRNEIRYKLLCDDITPPGLYVQIKLKYRRIGAGSFTEIDTFTLKPNPDGTVYFYCQGYLDSYLDYVRPIVGDISTDANNQAVEFYIDFREITDATPDPSWTTTESSHVGLAIKAGVEPWKNARNNFFINYLELDKPFLTWQPNDGYNKKFVFSDQLLWLSVFNPVNTVTGFQLEVTVTYTDSTTDVFTVPLTTGGTVMHIAADLATLGIVPTSDVWYYDLELTQVLSGASSTIAGSYRYYYNYDPVYQYYDLYYHNSLGGFDPVRVRGEVSRFVDIDSREAQGGLQLEDWTSANKPFESAIVGTTGKRRYSGTIGFANTRKEQEALLEILFSESTFQLIDERWVPVVRITKSKELNKTTDQLWSFDAEWQLSAASATFTPEDQVFGEGDAT